MNQFATHGQFFVKASCEIVGQEDIGHISVQVIDVESGLCYAQRIQKGSEEDTVLQAVLDSRESNSIAACLSNSTLTLTHTRVLASGLELKPQRLSLTPAEPVSLINLIGELCADYVTLQSKLKAARSEADMQAIHIEDMVQEKERFQDSVLKRVSAIIEDRNAHLTTAQFSVKKELAEE